MIVSFYSFHHIRHKQDQLQVYHVKDSNSNDALAQSSDSVIISLYENAQWVKSICMRDHMIEFAHDRIRDGQQKSINIFDSHSRPNHELIKLLQYDAIAIPMLYTQYFEVSNHCHCI